MKNILNQIIKQVSKNPKKAFKKALYLLFIVLYILSHLSLSIAEASSLGSTILLFNIQGNTPLKESTIITYVVKKGDTLSRISNHFKVDIDSLAKINNIVNKDLIRIGDVLMIYQKNEIKRKETISKIQKEIALLIGKKFFIFISPNIKRMRILLNKYFARVNTVLTILENLNLPDVNKNILTINNADSVITYTVRKGDTLSQISKCFNVTIDTLVNTNHIINRNLIREGTLLNIPLFKKSANKIIEVKKTTPTIYRKPKKKVFTKVLKKELKLKAEKRLFFVQQLPILGWDIPEINRIDQLISYVDSPEKLEYFLSFKIWYEKDAHDYWQLAEETLAKKSGDCEDFAVLCHTVLKQLKFKTEIICVFTEHQKGHAVCTFRWNNNWYYFNNSTIKKTPATSLSEIPQYISKNYAKWCFADTKGNKYNYQKA